MKSKTYRPRLLVAAMLLLLLMPFTFEKATAEVKISVAVDTPGGYSRDSFRHWIDADRNGCNTRAEVLIEEAIVKPKIGSKCKLTGGKWLSSYDGKVISNASLLDVDHLVPLAEAWRSGAWEWSSLQRQLFANDLKNRETLRAVSLNSNRSKGDSDVSNWLPSNGKCQYVVDWIKIKIQYSLSVDYTEAAKLQNLTKECSLLGITFLFPQTNNQTATPTANPSPTLTSNPIDVTDNECPKIVRISIDKQILTSNEKTILRFTYEDDKNSFDASASGYSIWTKPSNLGTLEGGNPSISKLTIIKSTTINGRILEEVEGTLTAPTAMGIWKFGALVVYDKGGNWISFEGGNQLCSRRGYIAAPEYNLDLTVTTSNPTPTPTPTPTIAEKITPGAFCSPSGATGKSATGTLYTCKTSPTDSRNRWRQ